MSLYLTKDNKYYTCPKLGPDGQRTTDHAIAEGNVLLAAIETALAGEKK